MGPPMGPLWDPVGPQVRTLLHTAFGGAGATRISEPPAAAVTLIQYLELFARRAADALDPCLMCRLPMWWRCCLPRWTLPDVMPA